jgi:hypothetical protein
MSILNHFGKVKTTFVPYKSKYTAERKIYYPGQAVGPDKQYIPYTFAYHIHNDPRAQPVHVPFENEESWIN